MNHLQEIWRGIGAQECAASNNSLGVMPTNKKGLNQSENQNSWHWSQTSLGANGSKSCKQSSC